MAFSVSPQLYKILVDGLFSGKVSNTPFYTDGTATWLKHDQITLSNSIDGLKIEFSYKGTPTLYQIVEGMRFENDNCVVIPVTGQMPFTLSE